MTSSSPFFNAFGHEVRAAECQRACRKFLESSLSNLRGSMDCEGEVVFFPSHAMEVRHSYNDVKPLETVPPSNMNAILERK